VEGKEKTLKQGLTKKERRQGVARVGIWKESCNTE
jgi:hypothetical protein